MIIFSIVFFILSLALITGLLSVKYFELRRGIVIAPLWRERADEKARVLKEAAYAAEAHAAELPALALALMRVSVHASALVVARLARLAEEKAHALADYVSHKRGFERREARSEFLKKVIEHKNGNGTNSVTHI